jgi:hypothetical protein
MTKPDLYVLGLSKRDANLRCLLQQAGSRYHQLDRRKGLAIWVKARRSGYVEREFELAVRNRRGRRIWRAVALDFAVFFVVNVVIVFLGSWLAASPDPNSGTTTIIEEKE